MRYRHIPTGQVAEFIRVTRDGYLLCWFRENDGSAHYMVYPAEQWEAA